jgi:integrase
VTPVPQSRDAELTAPALAAPLLRRRSGAGCVHPVYVEGQLTAWRGLASYKDAETGRQRRRSVTRKTKIAAEKALKVLIASLPKAQLVSRRKPGTVGLPPATDEASLLAYLHRRLNHKRRELRPTTYRAYVNELLHLTPELGEIPLLSLSAMQIQQAITDRQDRQLSTAKCLSTALRTLRMALRQAVLWGVMPSNPASMARAPRTRPKEMTVWDQEQTGRFLDHAGQHRLAPLFTLALSTGMRRGEMLALAWGDLDLEGADLSVTRNYIRDITGEWVLGEPKTRAGFRSIPLADDIVALLRKHRLEEEGWFGPRTGEHPVFTRSSGERLDSSNVARLFHRLVREAGVPRIRFHDLRHTAASLLIRQGVPAKVVSDRLGHADVAFTLSVYTHLYDDQRRAAAIPLSQLLSGTPSGPQPAVQRDELVAQLQQLIATLLKER